MRAGSAGGLSLLLLVAGCGGGGSNPPAPTVGASSGYDDPGATRDDAGSARDDPGTTRDDPGSSSDNTAACLQCDVIYSCTGGISAGRVSTSQGECTPAFIDAVCSGTLFQTGACSSNPNGSFTCGAITCSPEPHGG